MKEHKTLNIKDDENIKFMIEFNGVSENQLEKIWDFLISNKFNWNVKKANDDYSIKPDDNQYQKMWEELRKEMKYNLGSIDNECECEYIYLSDMEDLEYKYLGE